MGKSARHLLAFFFQTSQRNSLVRQELVLTALGCLSNAECFKLFGILCLDICSRICLCIQGNQLDAEFFKLVLHLNTVEARRNSTAESLQSQE